MEDLSKKIDRLALYNMADTIATAPPSVATLALNAALQAIDKALCEMVDAPDAQMGVLAMAQALAFRRVLIAKQITSERKRLEMATRVGFDVTAKLRQHAKLPAIFNTKR